MKVTIYELIGLVKDNEAPRKIKMYDKILKLKTGKQKNYVFDNGNTLAFDYYIEEQKLNEEVEIIEEDRKIEKISLPSFDEFKRMSAEERYIITAKEYDLLDEIIDEINKLKEND